MRLTLNSKRLAVLYLVFALPLTAYLTWRIPPFQGPDEDNHFLRAVQVAQLGIAADHLPGGVLGGRLPSGADRLAHGFNDLHAMPHVRITAERLASAQRVTWGTPIPSGFANTAIYPPIFYIPAAAAIMLARASNQSVLTGLRMARLANAVSAIGVASLAIGLAMSGSLFLFWLLSLPMTTSLFASCSQDALVIACSALVAASLSRLACQRDPSFTIWAMLALAMGCLGAAKPPYLPLCVLPALWAGIYGHLSSGRILALLLLPFAIGFGWLALGAAPVVAPNTAAQQARFMLDHPFAIPRVAYETCHQFGFLLLTQFIGVLGWLDVQLPRRFYPLALLVLTVLLVVQGIGRQDSRLAAIASMHLMLASCAAVCTAFYIGWTPVGSDVIEGLQGRYFIPVAAFAALLLRRPQIYPKGIGPLMVLWASGCAVVTVVAVDYHYAITG